MKKTFVLVSVSVFFITAILTGAVFLVTKTLSNDEPTTEQTSADNNLTIISEPVSNPETIGSKPENQVSNLLEAKNYSELRNVLNSFEASDNLELQSNNAQVLTDEFFNLLQKDTDYVIYETQEGDSFIKIARKFQKKTNKTITYGAIKFFNGFKNDILKPYKKIMVPTGDFSVLILKEKYKLILQYNNLPAKVYDVGIGKDDLTPSAQFEVGDKTAKPNWYSPKDSEYKGAIIAYGDQRNILGTHWIELDHVKYQGLGLHGTNNSDSIGTKSSRGCVRLDNNDIKELYEILPKGATVTIN